MELRTQFNPTHRSAVLIWILLLTALPFSLQTGHSRVYKLPDRVFVVAMNATESMFSISTVPEVQNETYGFRGEAPGGLRLDVNTGMVTVEHANWHNDEINITLQFIVTSPQKSDDLDVRVYRVERGAYSALFTNSPVPLTCEVPQWIRPDTPIYTLTAIDLTHYGATITYQLQAGGDGRFMVDAMSGQLRVLKRLPFDMPATFELAISAEVVGMAASRRPLTQVVTVKVGDMMPQFSQPEYVINMDEFGKDNTPTVNNPIATIKVLSFYDLPMNFDLSPNAVANGTVAANKFRVENSGKEGAVTSGALIPVDGVVAISALTDPRQYRLTLTATEVVSGFNTSVQVIVNVLDTNDHTPFFLSAVYTRYNVPEDAPIGSLMVTVKAVDRDEGDNGRLTFDVDDEHFEAIDVDNTTAEIKTKKTLTFRELPMGWYELTVTATDHGSPNKTGNAKVRIWVLNKNLLVFEPAGQVAYVREKLKSGALIHAVQAHNSNGSPFTFSFQGAASFNKFSIDENTGHITLNQDFPDNKMEKIHLPVTLCDRKNHEVTQNITVDIMGINRPPKIPECTTYKPSVKEGAPIGTSVISIAATDPDSGSNGELAFSLAGLKTSKKAFDIEQDPTDPYKATLKTKVEMYREDPLTDYNCYRIGDATKCPVTVVVWDNNGDPNNKHSLSTTCFFLVTLDDINNNSPAFDNDEDFVRNPPYIKEHPAIDERLFRVFAFDRDLGVNGEVEYQLQNLNCNGCLVIDTDGYISAAIKLPTLETVTDISARVTASDKGTDPTEPDFLNITLRRNDDRLPPMWELVNGTDIDQLTLDLDEDAGPDTIIATDFSVKERSGTDIDFILPRGIFPENNQDQQFSTVVDTQPNTMRLRKRIQKQSGGKDPLKYIKLRALYPTSATVQTYADKRLKINFTDVNLNTPMFAGRNNLDQYPAHVSTESEIGETVANVFAVDEDSTATYNSVTYHFDEADCSHCLESFTINETTGEVNTKRKFDRPDEGDYFILNVYARDGLGFSEQCRDVKVNCYRKAESAPLVVNLARPVPARPFFREQSYVKEVDEGFYPNKKLFKIDAEYTGADTMQVQYSLLDGNEGRPFAVEPSTGEVYQVSRLDFAIKKEYIIRYGVFHGELSNSTTLKIKVNEKPCLKPFTFTTIDNSIPIYSNTLIEEDFSETKVVTLKQSHVAYTLIGPLSDSFRMVGLDVHIARPLDRDYPMGHSDWQVTVEAVCSRNPTPDNATRTYAIVNVKLTDINDNSPVFDTRTLHGSIMENTIASSTTPADVLRVVALDFDDGMNAKVRYVIEAMEDHSQFIIGLDDGMLRATVPFDREKIDAYRVVVTAYDLGPKGEGSAPVLQYIWVTIDDENDNPPKFSAPKKYDATVPENLPLGASVLSVLAEDADIGDNARRDYSVEHNHFVIDSIYATGAGVVKIKQLIDYDTMGTVKFLTFVVKVKGPKIDDTDEAEVTVHITDVNDNAPVVCPKASVTPLVGVDRKMVQELKCPVKPSGECPESHNVTVVEGTPKDTLVAEFTGCDEDTGANSEFTYYIDYKNTDQEKNFEVTQSGTNASVKIRNPLDREKLDKHVVQLLAVDEGDPPQTGTAILMVTVGDVNDHAPEFENPDELRVVRATGNLIGTVVGEWRVIDRDGPTNGPPFTVTLDCQDAVNTRFCGNFSYDYTNGKVIVTTKIAEYERTATFKRFSASFVLIDSGNPKMKATRQLLVEVEDTNTNQHKASTKYVTVYSLNGLFTGMTLGHIYAEDVDDWDRTEKTYTLVSPPDGFRLAPGASWDLMLDLGVDPTMHRVEVDVEDTKFGTVRSTMAVKVNFLYAGAIHSSGSIRLQNQGLTPTNLIERSPGQSSSLLDKLTTQIAVAVGSVVDDVDVFNIHQVVGEQDALDVYYAVSRNTQPVTYLRPSRLDGNIWISREKIKEALGGVRIVMAPVNACTNAKCWEGTCHNRLVTVPTPITVDANATSRVGVNVSRQAVCECDALQLPPEPEVCTETMCLNGGTCQQTWANANCSCPIGFEGPRCQKLSRSFTGDSWAWFNPLYLCLNDVIRFQFASSAPGEQQLLAYSGPLQIGDNPIHLILQLRSDGYPGISIDAGSGPASAHVAGVDTSGSRTQPRLDDGSWHTLEVFKTGNAFRLVIDHCEHSVITETWNGTQEDRSACEATLTAPGDDLHVTFSTPLQLGGRRPSAVKLPLGFGDGGLKGCIKDFFHNGEMYDLYVGEVGQAANSLDSFPAVGATYKTSGGTEADSGTTYVYDGEPDGELYSTSSNQTCASDALTGGATICTCLPRRRGANCTEVTTTRDFLTDKAYLEWEMNAGPSNSRKEFIQLSFRSRKNDLLLFFAESHTTLERCFLEIVDSHLTFTYDLGSGDQTLSLNKLNVTDGLWHTAYVSRYGNQVMLTVDGGEGRYYNETKPSDDFRLLLLEGMVDGGAAISYKRFHTIPHVNNNMKHSYLTDVRFSPTRPGDQPLAMTMSENTESAGELQNDNTNDVSVGPVPNPLCDVTRCSDDQTCLDVWRLTYCGCTVNQTLDADGACHTLQDCSMKDCGPQGTCVPQEDLTARCYYPPPDVYDAHAALAGSALAIIIGALLIMLLLLLLSTIVSKKEPPPPLLKPDFDLENHTRENTISYEVEGAVDELPLMGDFNSLKVPLGGLQRMTGIYSRTSVKEPSPEVYRMRALYSRDVNDLILKNKMAVDDDDDYPEDCTRTFEHEGSASLATSLSSLQSTSSGNVDYNDLVSYGPPFQKLADLYGHDDEDSDDSDDVMMAYPENVLVMDPTVNHVFVDGELSPHVPLQDGNGGNGYSEQEHGQTQKANGLQSPNDDRLENNQPQQVRYSLERFSQPDDGQSPQIGPPTSVNAAKPQIYGEDDRSGHDRSPTGYKSGGPLPGYSDGQPPRYNGEPIFPYGHSDQPIDGSIHVTNGQPAVLDNYNGPVFEDGHIYDLPSPRQSLASPRQSLASLRHVNEQELDKYGWPSVAYDQPLYDSPSQTPSANSPEGPRSRIGAPLGDNSLKDYSRQPSTGFRLNAPDNPGVTDGLHKQSPVFDEVRLDATRFSSGTPYNSQRESLSPRFESGVSNLAFDGNEDAEDFTSMNDAGFQPLASNRSTNQNIQSPLHSPMWETNSEGSSTSSMIIHTPSPCEVVDEGYEQRHGSLPPYEHGVVNEGYDDHRLSSLSPYGQG